jgi:hypothetical protein
MFGEVLSAFHDCDTLSSRQKSLELNSHDHQVHGKSGKGNQCCIQWSRL